MIEQYDDIPVSRQFCKSGGLMRVPVFGRRMGGMLRTAYRGWRTLGTRYLGDSITCQPKVEYLVWPI